MMDADFVAKVRLRVKSRWYVSDNAMRVRATEFALLFSYRTSVSLLTNPRKNPKVLADISIIIFVKCH
jgi:hypothetical protein